MQEDSTADGMLLSKNDNLKRNSRINHNSSPEGVILQTDSTTGRIVTCKMVCTPKWDSLGLIAWTGVSYHRMMTLGTIRLCQTTS
jgi:hypothetical protein